MKHSPRSRIYRHTKGLQFQSELRRKQNETTTLYKGQSTLCPSLVTISTSVILYLSTEVYMISKGNVQNYLYVWVVFVSNIQHTLF